MNENLAERFGRSRSAHGNQRQQVLLWVQPQQLNPKVRKYFEDGKEPADGGAWLRRPEIPASEEVLLQDTDDSSSDSHGLQPNRPEGSWESKEAYLRAQYELLREDAIRPLREAVSRVKFIPTGTEASFEGTGIGIYDKIHICGITCSTRGIAVRVTFSLHRVGKKILWEQSKRLITGSLVVLTPASDMFKTKAVVATVAARPLAGLQQNPPEIDLFFARPEDIELDPAEEWVMVEDRGGLYEAQRHTLVALQRMMKERFPLAEHLVSTQSDVPPPQYLKNNSKTDMTAVLINNKHETYEEVNLLNSWPSQPQCDLDSSQLEALRRILTKRLAIVQGPPGTGKTHVSVEAIKVFLANRKRDDPPIIIACQTNHAVDQLLRHIAKFEDEFARLGGRSKDREVIKPRTLFELQNQSSDNPLPGSLTQRARKRMRDMEKEIALLLSGLKPGDSPLDFKLLQNFGLISQQQAETLEAGASQWVQDQLSKPNEARSPFMVWLGKNLITVPPKQQPEKTFGFDYEEADIEFEQLKELEAENMSKDDEDHESLSGGWYPIADNFTCRKTAGMTESKVKEALKEQDMWKIPEAVRPAVYRHLQAEFKSVILTALRAKAKTFNDEAVQRRIGTWERQEVILKKQKIIGMTTTGFSKYRGLLAALEPKIVLIEEAAETLEAPVTVTCLPSLQHLILVGDHQQLRPHCHVKAHEDKPFYLNVSLFERLVTNNVEYGTLSKQRRMIPEIRRLLHPIYGNLIKDHASVLIPENRPNVPGMGGINSYFFTHQWPEQRDDQMSAFNQNEADMVVGLVEYLVYNDVRTDQITVLTFYNGQRKRILKQLRECASLKSPESRRFNVVTVDSYQGEENEVVILSLVRSNDKGQIGFLNINNRVCVALSRAKCGFYIFGNGQLLYKHKIWKNVLKIIANKGPPVDHLKSEPSFRLGQEFPLTCKNHNNQTSIKDASDFDKIFGGCSKVKCDAKLQCGHPCDLMCHPFSHDKVICHQPCGKNLRCGHPCRERCGETCSCKPCSKKLEPSQSTNSPAKALDGQEELSRVSTPDSWESFAKSEPERYAVAASAPVSKRSSPLKQTLGSPLLDLSSADHIEQGVGKLRLDVDGSTSRPPGASPTKLIEEKMSKDGTRMKRKEKLIVVKEMEVEADDKEDWSKKESLLD